jgi:acetyl-CoA C-acetyltransferase
MPEAVIVAATRSPIGRAFKGSLTDLRPDDLAATVIRAALDQVPELDPADIDDLMLGCGLPGGEQGFNMGRVVAVLLGLDALPGTTITRYCASSLQTSRMAMHAIKAGEGDVFLSAGVETVYRYLKGSSDAIPDTQNPIFAGAQPGSPPPHRTAPRPGPTHGAGGAARRVHRHGTHRGEPRTCQRGDPRRDEPVFRPDGRVTAGNACPLNDGAAALIIMSDTKARDLGLTPIARIVSTGVTGLSPELMGYGPVQASRQALARAGMTLDDLDLVEINEAFAAQVIPSYRDLGIDPDTLNVHGGAIVLLARPQQLA